MMMVERSIHTSKRGFFVSSACSLNDEELDDKRSVKQRLNCNLYSITYILGKTSMLQFSGAPWPIDAT